MKTVKKLLASFLVVVMVLCSAPFEGFVGLEMPSFDWFKTTASAADEEKFVSGIYTYTVSNGEATIIDVDENVSGEIIIPSTLGGYPVTSIGDWAFWLCTSLTSIEIPDSVTSIGDSAFSYCKSLTSIEIPDSVTSIGDYVFKDCKSLTSIEIPNNITSIGDYVFDNCDSLKRIIVDIRNENYSSDEYGVLFNKDKTELIRFPEGSDIKEYVILSTVTSIGNRAFVYCKNLTSIKIPDSVTNIGEKAFYECSNLTSIKISNSVTSIGDYAFSYCDSLISIEIPDSVTSIGDYTFYYCKSLTSIEIPDSVTSIGEEAFYACSNLTSIKIPNSITSIESESFSNCSSLTSIEIPDSVTSIGDYAFSYCDSLISIEIPGSVTSIGDGAFGYCSSLTSIEIPDSVMSIGNSAFYDCKSLTSIEIPNSVTSIGGAAFRLCNSLTSVKIPDSVTSIEPLAFSCCISLTSIEIPDGVTIIGECAFSFCENLISIEIPDSVTSIGDWAFYMCSSLTSIEIPNSVTSIGIAAFFCCSGLISVEISKNVENIDECAFGYEVNEETETYELKKVDNFTIYGYKDTEAERYAIKNGFTFIPFCEHKNVEITERKEPTCTEIGNIEYKKCLDCDVLLDSSDNEITEAEIIIDSLGHDYSIDWTVDKEATCTADGIKSHHCSRCDSKINVISIPALGHNFGDWTITEEPTYEQNGSRFKECSVCHDTVVEEIPKLVLNEVTKGDFTMIFDDETFDGDVELEIEKVREGSAVEAFAIKGYNKFDLYNISVTKNGEKVQPNKTLTIKTPIPADYNESTTAVYYIAKDNSIEKMPSYVKDGYIYFETDHFSHYVIVDESQKVHTHTDNNNDGYCDTCGADINPVLHCSCNCHSSGIKKFFFNFILFFQKLFKANRVCSCGNYHY